MTKDPLLRQESKLSKGYRQSNSRLSKISSHSFKKLTTAHEVQEQKIKHISEEIIKELNSKTDYERKREEDRAKREEEKRKVQVEQRRAETERKLREKAEEERLVRQK